MTKEFRLPEPDFSQFIRHVAGLRSQLAGLLETIPPQFLAERAGARLIQEPPGGLGFQLDFWGQPLRINSPGWVAVDLATGRELSPPDQALILFYLVTADGTQVDPGWISFSDLPDGRFYVKAFQGYTGRILAGIFKNDLQSLKAAALSCGAVIFSPGDQFTGNPLPGDLAFIFPALPRLPILLAYWLGDDEFEPSAQILFADVTPHYLPTYVCAYLGSSLVSRIKRARPSPAAS